MHRQDAFNGDNVHIAFGRSTSSAGVQAGIDGSVERVSLDARVISAAPFAGLFNQLGLPQQDTVVGGSASSFMRSDDGRNTVSANAGGLLSTIQDGAIHFASDIGILQSINFREAFSDGLSTTEQIQLTIRNTPDAIAAWSNVFAPQLVALFVERARGDVLSFRGLDASGLPAQLVGVEVMPGSDDHGVDSLPDVFQLTTSVDTSDSGQ